MSDLILARRPGLDVWGDVRDWVLLLKPRVMALVVMTGWVGLMIAPGRIHPIIAGTAILAIAVAAGAAGAINMWYDRDIDAIMRRTRNRPIPAGRIAPDEALGFGLILSVLSVTVMAVAVNLVAGALLAGSIAFYVFVYTMWLKRRTVQNIVIGGAAGAFPPMIGWAAVTGSVDIMPVLLFAIIFFWTPPHFWALSLYATGDYARAGVPMLPVVEGPRATRRQIVCYAILLCPIAMLPWLFGVAGPIYGLSAAVLSTIFLGACLRVWRDAQDDFGRSLTGDAPARLAFRVSLLYLAILYAAVAVDHMVW